MNDDQQPATKGDLMVLKKELKTEFKNHPTKDDSKEALKNHPTKDDLKEALKNHPTKDDLKEILKNYATKDDLKSSIQEVLEILAVIMRKQDEHQEDLRRYCGVLIEEAEERFLKTGYDEISVNRDRINQHEGRIERLEAAVF